MEEKRLLVLEIWRLLVILVGVVMGGRRRLRWSGVNKGFKEIKIFLKGFFKNLIMNGKRK